MIIVNYIVNHGRIFGNKNHGDNAAQRGPDEGDRLGTTPRSWGCSGAACHALGQVLCPSMHFVQHDVVFFPLHFEQLLKTEKIHVLMAGDPFLIHNERN